MQFPESWLREFCNPSLTTQELADTLTMAGLEVEELQPVAPPFTGIVVGEIKEAVQHPDADRLRICQVDVGQGALLNIVCGAPNARVGIKIPAPPWAQRRAACWSPYTHPEHPNERSNAAAPVASPKRPCSSDALLG